MATTINFTLDGLYGSALTKIANQNGMTPNQYAESQLKSFLRNMADGYYNGKFDELSLIEKIQLFGDIE